MPYDVANGLRPISVAQNFLAGQQQAQQSQQQKFQNALARNQETRAQTTFDQNQNALMQGQQKQVTTEQANQTYTEASYIEQAPDAQIPQLMQQLPHVAQAAQQAGIQAGDIQGLRRLATAVKAKAGAFLGKGPEAPDYKTVGTNLVQTNAQGGAKSVYSAPEKPQTISPADAERIALEKRRVVLAESEARKPKADKKDAPAGYRWSGDSLEAIPGGPADMSNPSNARKGSMPLRKEFEDSVAVKQYRSVLPLYQRAATAPNTRAGDNSIVYAFGKMFDPNSVVREGELKLAAGAAPWVVKAAQQINSQITGQGALSPGTRKEIIDSLKGQVDALKLAHDQERTRYSGYAQDSGIDPNLVVGTDPAAAFATTKPPAPAAALEYLKAHPETKAAFKEKYGYSP